MTSWDRYDGGDNVSHLPLRLRRARRLNPSDIPPRQWLYGTVLQRRYTSMLVAPGGTGKSQLALGMALDLVSGRRLLGFHIFERVPVWYLNLEDDENELDRRIAAFRIAHNVGWDELDNFYVHAGRERPVCMARFDPSDGSTIVFPDREEITASARAGGVGAIWVDPFVRSHMLDENSNPQMDAAVAAWTAVSDEVGCAVGLVHHVRKGPISGIEAARGAKALSDATRVGLLLSAMTEDEARDLGLGERQSHRFLRLDNAKANMAPAIDAMWFEMIEHNLGNASAVYPHGDTVSALTRWIKPTPWDALDSRLLGEIFGALRAGPGDGEQFTLTRRGRDAPRWAGAAVMRITSVSQAQAEAILKGWNESGVLRSAEYYSERQRKLRIGMVMDETKVDSIIASQAPHAGCANSFS